MSASEPVFIKLCCQQVLSIYTSSPHRSIHTIPPPSPILKSQLCALYLQHHHTLCSNFSRNHVKTWCFTTPSQPVLTPFMESCQKLVSYNTITARAHHLWWNHVKNIGSHLQHKQLPLKPQAVLKSNDRATFLLKKTLDKARRSCRTDCTNISWQQQVAVQLWGTATEPFHKLIAFCTAHS